MRLGGPIFTKYDSPKAWIKAVQAKGFRAASCPASPATADAEIQDYRQAAADADIVIAEVGAWSNPIIPDPAIRSEALEKCKRGLDLAEKIGARCCVNIAGSRGVKWDGPCAEDLTPATFDLIVASVQEIIDAVDPQQTRYTLETMPWMYPDSVDSYLELMRAIERPGFAVHLDPVNLINCPSRYFNSGDLLRECFAKLGPHILSCHAKDIAIADRLTLHLDEVRPGAGDLDFATYLRELDKLDPDTPLMLEHLPNEGEYDLAAAHVRQVAQEIGCSV